MRVIAEDLGVDYLRSATDCYLGSEDGAALARSVLQVLRPSQIRPQILELLRTRDWKTHRVQAAGDLLALVVTRSDAPLVTDMLGSHELAVRAAGARAAIALAERTPPTIALLDTWVSTLLLSAPELATGSGLLLLELRLDLSSRVRSELRNTWRKQLLTLGPDADDLVIRISRGSRSMQR